MAVSNTRLIFQEFGSDGDSVVIFVCYDEDVIGSDENSLILEYTQVVLCFFGFLC